MTPPRRLPLVITLAALAAAGGCASPPDKELHRAEGAIDTARAAGAPRYATEEFSAAEAALARAAAAVAQRDYRLALNGALDARERALVAARTATESRARVRSQIEQQVADIETARRSLDARLAEAETAKVAPQALAAGRASSARVAKALTEVRPLLDAGDDDKAAALLMPLAAQLTTARSEIDAVVKERNSRRPTRRARL